MNGIQDQEDKRLKKFLVLQSFCPLFILIFIKHVGHTNKIALFFSGLCHGDLCVIGKAITDEALGDIVISFICLMWFLLAGVSAHGFKQLQKQAFSSQGQEITILKEKKDSGLSFLVSFILPLLVEDVSSIRGLLFFITLMVMVIFLLIRSDLFYQNPVLVVLGYRTFEFQFKKQSLSNNGNEETYIGITKGGLPQTSTIKRRYISDGVFLIYNEE